MDREWMDCWMNERVDEGIVIYVYDGGGIRFCVYSMLI